MWGWYLCLSCQHTLEQLQLTKPRSSLTWKLLRSHGPLVPQIGFTEVGRDFWPLFKPPRHNNNHKGYKGYVVRKLHHLNEYKKRLVSNFQLAIKGKTFMLDGTSLFSKFYTWAKSPPSFSFDYVSRTLVCEPNSWTCYTKLYKYPMKIINRNTENTEVNLITVRAFLRIRTCVWWSRNKRACTTISFASTSYCIQHQVSEYIRNDRITKFVAILHHITEIYYERETKKKFFVRLPTSVTMT